MSKKAKKPKTAKSTKNKQQAVPVDDPEPWIEELKTFTINDDQWHCNVTLLMDTNSLNMCYVTSFNDVFSNGKNVRRCIKVISNTSLACSVLEQSYKLNDKKDPTKIAYAKLCDEALKYFAPDGFTLDIPPEILASLIKYQLYYTRLENYAETQRIKEYEQKKQTIKDDSLTQLMNIVKRTPTSKNVKSKGSPKKMPKSGGKKVVPAKFTTLRKRNEEFFDHVYVHDEEPSGPNVYVILTSFRLADLPLALLKLKIPLIGIIKLHDLVSEDTDCTLSPKDNRRFCFALVSIIKGTKLKQRRYSNPKEESYLYDMSLKKFWGELLQILSKKDNVSFFKDTMFFKFYPYSNSTNKLKDSASRNGTLGFELQQSIYNQFCFLQYDLQDLMREHKNYVNHLIIKDVKEKNNFSFDDMQVYSSIMDSIPSEVINIPLILNAIIVQVDHLSGNLVTARLKSTSFSENDNTLITTNIIEKEKKLLTHLNELDKTYDLFYHEEKLPEASFLAPVVLVEGDEIGLKSYWCDERKDFKSITCHILSCFWDMFFRRHLPQYDDIFSSCIQDGDTDLFELLKATGNLTFFYKLSNLPCNFNEIFVEDKPYVFCSESFREDSEETRLNSIVKDDYEDISNVIDTYDEAKKTFRHYSNPSEGHYMGQIYDHHSYCFEEMTSDVLLQKLFKSFESFNCIDLQQDYFRDKLFLKFHNRKTCANEEYLMGTLRTPTALRDFYDYTVDEEFYWLNEQELTYTELLKKREGDQLNYELKQLQHLKNKTTHRVAQICAENNFFLPDSVKSKIHPPLERFSLMSQASRRDSEYIKKSSVCEFLEGFDIDIPNRVQFSERRQEIVLSANSKLFIKKLSRLYFDDDDAVFFQTTIHGHTLYYFRPINKVVSKHFHLIHESGMIFYFSKNLNNSDFLNDQSEDFNKMNGEIKLNGVVGGTEAAIITKTDNSDCEDIFKKAKYHLSLSLPNSLYLQVVNPHSQPISLYIKQYYLCETIKHIEVAKEKFRCSLLDGKLIKFMKDDSVIIYYPNSEIYCCKKVSYKSSSFDDTLSDVIRSVQKEQTPDVNKIKKQKSPPTSKTREGKNDLKDDDLPQSNVHDSNNTVTTVIDSYECTLTSGRRILVDGEQTTELEPLFCKSYTDLLKGIIVTERHDGTKLTHNFEGSLTVDFPDGSRITTFAAFTQDEIFIDLSEHISTETFENFEESIEHNESYSGNESEEEESDLPSQGFVFVQVSYLIEHSNFSSITINKVAEILDINLPHTVHLSLNSEGLYTVNFNNKAELKIDENDLSFTEINLQKLPEYNFHLFNNNCNNIIKNEGDVKAEVAGKLLNPVLSCKSDDGNIFEVDCMGDIHLDEIDSVKHICKCSVVSNNQLFIVDNQFNGLQVFPPNVLDTYIEEAENDKDCIARNYASVDHHVLLLLKLVLQNESEKWLNHFKKIEQFRRFSTPSTYNNQYTRYNPFPKKKAKSHLPRTEVAHAFLVKIINRVNCNIHLQKYSFLKNKTEADLLRVHKYSHLALQLLEQGNVPFCKADKTFIEFIKEDIIGRIISRVRRRVVKRLEYLKTEEYKKILRERKLLPYFEYAHGAVFLIILEILDRVIKGSYTKEEGSRLEKLFTAPLNLLTDDDLDFMHDKIAQFTVGSVCSCITNSLACKLRILLLAGRTLHGLIPDMITVFFSYAENMKRKRLEEERRRYESNLLKELLMRPIDLLTENDFEIVHDKLKNLPYCTCSESPEKCKLKILLLASAILNDFFPNLDSVFKTSNVNVII